METQNFFWWYFERYIKKLNIHTFNGNPHFYGRRKGRKLSKSSQAAIRDGKDYLIKEHGEAVDVMKSIKLSLDPKNIMNPGKVLEIDWNYLNCKL